MTSSAEEAILLFKKWQSNSSRLRIVFGSDHARMTLHGKIAKIEGLSVACFGDDTTNELYFDFKGSPAIAFIDSEGLPSGFNFLKSVVVDELVTATFEDGVRLTLLTEKAPSAI